MTGELFNDEPLPLPTRILLLENPIIRNGARGHRQLEELVGVSGLLVEPVKTDCDPNVTAEKLSKLEPTDLLYVIGGDGTVNQAIDAATRTGALLLPTRSGNANDLAMSMNGRTEPWQVFRGLLDRSTHAASVHPIEVSINSGNTIETRSALNYASFGYAGLASHNVDEPWTHPGLKRAFDTLPPPFQTIARLPKDGNALMRAAKDAEQFDLTLHGSEKSRRAVDVSVVHSHRMAKFGKFPVDHTDPRMYASVLMDIDVPIMMKLFGLMVVGKMAGEYVKRLDFRMVNTSENDLYYQVDGEASPLPDRSDVKIGLAKSFVRILSTRLH